MTDLTEDPNVTVRTAILNSPEETHEDRLLKPGEVASLFGVTPKCVTDWVKAGKITAQRTFGGHRRYRESEIRAALAELQAAALDDRPRKDERPACCNTRAVDDTLRPPGGPEPWQP